MKSPIEETFAYHLGPVALARKWQVRRQVPIGKYVADFLIQTPESGVLVVECDGHDFHERTKEQAAHDRRRDRFVIAVIGAIPVRFTGSEIVRDVAMCIADLVEIVDELASGRFDEYRRGLEDGFQRGIEHAVEAMSIDDEDE